MSKPPDLRTMRWQLAFHATVDAPRGKIDNYIVHDPVGHAENMIAFTVPHGRPDIADFIVRCLRAGQNTLNALPPGVKFVADEAMPYIGRKPH